jgi:hypothetical protein
LTGERFVFVGQLFIVVKGLMVRHGRTDNNHQIAEAEKFIMKIAFLHMLIVVHQLTDRCGQKLSLD